MPHLVLEGALVGAEVAPRLRPEVRRWGRAVLKTECSYLRQDHQALLVQGVVVELRRPLHPVALVESHGRRTTVRLWQAVPVERTEAVQRWLALLAADLCGFGLGPLVSTNLAPELWADLPIPAAPPAGDR